MTTSSPLARRSSPHASDVHGQNALGHIGPYRVTRRFVHSVPVCNPDVRSCGMLREY